MGSKNHKIRLHKVNGIIIDVPEERMSIEDLRYIQKITASQNKDSPSSPGPRNGSDDDDPFTADNASIGDSGDSSSRELAVL